MKEKTTSTMVRWGWGLLLFLLLAARLPAAPAMATAAQQERRIEYQGPIGYGEQVIGTLMPEVVAQVWEFEGGQGDEIAIAMNALTEDLDPFLLLLEMSEADLEEFFALSDEEMADLPAAAEERGLLRGLDDDGGEDTNALIPSFVLPADGRYLIVATSCCTGETSGRYELILDFVGVQEPGGPEPTMPELRDYSPQEGQAGTELVLRLEGEALPALGSPQELLIGGQDVPILDFGIASDQIVEMAIRLPEETPPGEQEISFFFENGGFDGSFFVTEPDGSVPGGTGPEDQEPGEPPFAPPDQGPDTTIRTPDESFPTFWVGVILLLMIAGGAVAWRRLRPRPLPQQPAEGPAQAPPPDIRFEFDRDPGSQSLETDGGPLRADIDIRFRLRLEESTYYVNDDDTTLHGS